MYGEFLCLASNFHIYTNCNREDKYVYVYIALKLRKYYIKLRLVGNLIKNI